MKLRIALLTLILMAGGQVPAHAQNSNSKQLHSPLAGGVVVNNFKASGVVGSKALYGAGSGSGASGSVSNSGGAPQLFNRAKPSKSAVQPYDLNQGGIQSVAKPSISAQPTQAVTQFTQNAIPAPSQNYKAQGSISSAMFDADSVDLSPKAVVEPRLSDREYAREIGVSRGKLNHMREKMAAIEEVEAARVQSLRTAQAMAAYLPVEMQASYIQQVQESMGPGTAGDIALKAAVNTYGAQDIDTFMAVIENPKSRAAQDRLYKNVIAKNPQVRAVEAEALRIDDGR